MRHNLDNILKAVCIATGLENEYILGRARLREESEARHIFTSLAIENRHRIVDIANKLNKNHATVIHGRRQSYNLYETDNYFKQCYDDAKEILNDLAKNIQTKYINGYFNDKTNEFSLEPLDGFYKATATIKWGENNIYNE